MRKSLINLNMNPNVQELIILGLSCETNKPYEFSQLTKISNIKNIYKTIYIIAFIIFVKIETLYKDIQIGAFQKLINK